MLLQCLYSLGTSVPHLSLERLQSFTDKIVLTLFYHFVIFELDLFWLNFQQNLSIFQWMKTVKNIITFALLKVCKNFVYISGAKDRHFFLVTIQN